VTLKTTKMSASPLTHQTATTNSSGPTTIQTRSDELQDFLQQSQVYPHPSELEKRQHAMTRIGALFSTWCKDVLLRDETMTEDHASSLAGHLFTFGSYEIDVYSSDSDIDILCVAPAVVSRSSFNSEFQLVLEAERLVSELNPILTAKVPIIRLKFDGI
jgi:poly(A) polymerase